jgi:tetratricopeptide (TPR) repeat protein
MSRAPGAQAAIAADPTLQRLMADAQERMEAAPYVERFLDKAKAALAAGRADEARAAVEKARALDATHPAVAAMSARMAAGPSRPAGPAAPAAPRPAAAATVPPPVAPRPPAPPAPRLAAAPPPSLPPAAALPEAEPSLLDLPADEPVRFEPASGFAAVTPEPADELDLGGDLPLDLPPLDLPELDAPAGSELSFDELAAAPAASVSDADPRIAELLDEGQALFGRGELQGAIDAWSRIFLIDIDHQEAARRIDMARNAKAEQERLVEETYHDALARVQAGSLDEGRAALERVLQLQPNHVGARDALGKLDRGQLDELPRPPAAAAPAGDPLAALSAEGDDAVLQEEILVPPEPGSVPSRPAAAPLAAKGPESRRKLLIAAAAVIAVVAVAGWFLRERWSSLFPNTAAEPPQVARPADEQTPITRATQLAREGNRAMALAQLKRVPPPSPFYEEAQALIAQWEAEDAAGRAAAGPAPEQAARLEVLLAQARQAHAERRYLAVAPLLDQAATIAPLPAGDAALKADAERNLQSLTEPLTLLRNEEYERSLRLLWVAHEADRANPDVRHLLTGAYYNLGVLGLQQGKPEQAVEHLREAAQVSPDDREVERLLQLAQTYQQREPDLLYRIYTKYLVPRKL